MGRRTTGLAGHQCSQPCRVGMGRWGFVVRVGPCSCGICREELTWPLCFRLLRSGRLSASYVWMMSPCSASTTVCVRF